MTSGERFYASQQSINAISRNCWISTVSRITDSGFHLRECIFFRRVADWATEKPGIGTFSFMRIFK